MTNTMPERTLTEQQAARSRRCVLCEAPPGRPCQAKPEADHLARYLDAYTADQLSRAYLAAVVGELVVIDRAVMIPVGARRRVVPCVQCLRHVAAPRPARPNSYSSLPAPATPDRRPRRGRDDSASARWRVELPGPKDRSRDPPQRHPITERGHAGHLPDGRAGPASQDTITRPGPPLVPRLALLGISPPGRPPHCHAATNDP